MIRLAVAVAMAVLLVGTMPLPAQDMPEPAPQREWLKQWVGEWEYDNVSEVAPGQPPLRFSGTESVSMIGAYWLLAQNRAVVEGARFAAVLTLGYDAGAEKYTGTWVDSNSDYMWTYEGMLNEADGSLILSTEGPALDNPNIMTRYREVISFKTPDHKVHKGAYRTKDNEWIPFLTINYRRMK